MCTCSVSFRRAGLLLVAIPSTQPVSKLARKRKVEKRVPTYRKLCRYLLTEVCKRAKFTKVDFYLFLKLTKTLGWSNKHVFFERKLIPMQLLENLNSNNETRKIPCRKNLIAPLSLVVRNWLRITLWAMLMVNALSCSMLMFFISSASCSSSSDKFQFEFLRRSCCSPRPCVSDVTSSSSYDFISICLYF